MAQFLYPFYTLAYIGLLIWAIFLWFRGSSLALAIIFAIIVGLLYDNAVIGYGIYMGESELLLNMNKLRFLIHGVLTPLLILAALNQAKRFGIETAGKRWMQILFIVVALIFIGLGLAEFSNIHMEPVYFSGTLRYVDTNSTPPIPSIVTIVITAVLGIVIWRKAKWPWLFAAAAVMFVGSAIPPSIVGPTIGSGAEIVLILGFIFTEKNLKDRNEIPELVTTPLGK